MKIKRNQIVRIGASEGIPFRYWSRLARVSTFNGKAVLIQPRNRKTPMIAYLDELMPR